MKQVIVTASLILATATVSGCAGELRTVIEQLMEARRLTAEALLQFAKASEAGNLAVMADSDEASAVATRDVEAATNAVERDATALSGLLTRLGYSEEMAILEEFRKRFVEFRDLDRVILELAALDTNLKAQRLSFGQAQEAADAIRGALARVSAGSPGDKWQARALSAEVMASIREIQALQAPHIAEHDDTAMTRIEGRMTAAETSARQSLIALSKVAGPESGAGIGAATAALDRFVGVHAEVLTLSRRNSNVRALALSLGRKRTLAAACEERLRALQEALARRDIGPSR
jgi:hypothetical protein